MTTYEQYNVQCSEQKETNKASAVILVKSGATLKNAIIGKNQTEGVHCEQYDQISSDGRQFVANKVNQHNGCDTFSINNFYVQNFEDTHRSGGICKTVITRKIRVSNVLTVTTKSDILTVSQNYNDGATLRNNTIVTTKTDVGVYVWSQAVTKDISPVELDQSLLPLLVSTKRTTSRFSRRKLVLVIHVRTKTIIHQLVNSHTEPNHLSSGWVTRGANGANCTPRASIWCSLSSPSSVAGRCVCSISSIVCGFFDTEQEGEVLAGLIQRGNHENRSDDVSDTYTTQFGHQANYC